jgi:hypothetical protein
MPITVWDQPQALSEHELAGYQTKRPHSEASDTKAAGASSDMRLHEIKRFVRIAPL